MGSTAPDLWQTPAPEECEVRVLDLTTVPAPARAARRALASMAAQWPLREEAVDGLLLVASEMVTNAELHGDGPAHLEVARRGPMLYLAVADHGARWDTAEAEADADRESGRGLHLIEALSVMWGHHPRPGGGHEVWAVLPP